MNYFRYIPNHLAIFLLKTSYLDVE